MSEMSKDAAYNDASETAQHYKKNVTRSFIPITPEQIDAKLTGNGFYVSRKYDGLMAVLVWNGKDVAGFNSSGNLLGKFPCFDEAAKALKAAKLNEAVIAAELYAEESGGRSRVHDTIKALHDPREQDKLALAVFDIVSLDGKPASSWKETLEKLEGIFGKGVKARPALTAKAANREEVKKLFTEWVVEGGAEGVVVRGELPLVFKIKPKYSIDAVVIGFSVGAPASVAGTSGGAAPDEVRALLLALMDESGGYHVIGRTGNGIAAEERKALYEKLLPARIPSSYIESDSNHVAFYMVKPELVAQISANDVIFEDSSGPIYNQRLEIGSEGCRRTGSAPGFHLISPVFERFRDDKKAEPGDVRLGQIAELFHNPHAEGRAGGGELPKSELLKREVYKKESGGKLMALKFLLWKTNKEANGMPAYVAACVNYSSDRAEPLKQDLRISSDRTQIGALYDEFLAANVKKGWEKVG